MANKYWVSGGNGNITSTTNWSDSSGGASGAVIPGAGDDVFVDANSGTNTININSAKTWHSLDTTGSQARTITNTAALTIGGAGTLSTAAVFTIVANITWTHSGGLEFDNRSGGLTVTTNSVDLSSISGITSPTNTATITIADGLNIGAKPLDFGKGTWDSSSQTVTCGAFTTAGSATAKTLTITSGTFNCTSWNLSGTITFTGTSSTINISGNSTMFTGLTKAYGTVNFTGNGNHTMDVAANTFVNLSITPSSIASMSFGWSISISGTLTLTGASQDDRLTVKSLNLSVTITLTVGTTATISNTDFSDITAAGAATRPWTGTSLGTKGGNTDITFTGAVTRYWVGNSGNWNGTVWATTSGGTATANIMPLPQDTAIFDTNSFSGAGQTATINIESVGAIDASACSTYTHTISSSVDTIIYGDVTLHSGTTIGSSATSIPSFGKRGSTTLLTTNGGTFYSATAKTLYIYTVSGGVTLQDAASFENIDISLVKGTLSTNGFDLTCNTLIDSGSGTKAFTGHASSTLTLTGVASLICFRCNQTNSTLTTNSINISITDTGTSYKTFYCKGTGGGLTWGNLNITGGGTGAVGLATSGANTTWGTITINAPKTFECAGLNTIVCSDFVATGSAGNIITIQSSVAGNTWGLSKASGTVSCDYISLRDSAATGGAAWYAGANSTNVSGNSGWIFTAPPTGTPTVLMMGV